MINYNPSDDGITHINISTDSVTELGRRLHEFYSKPFSHHVHGYFDNLVGLKCYLRTGCKDNFYRSATPKDILIRFKESDKEWMHEYGLHLKVGYLSRVLQDPTMSDMLRDNKLPIVRYMLDRDNVPYTKDSDKVCIDMWTSIGVKLRRGDDLNRDVMHILTKLGYLEGAQ